MQENPSLASANENATKIAWTPMEIEYLGNAAHLVHGGGGKLSTTGGDPGEHRKQKGNN